MVLVEIVDLVEGVVSAEFGSEWRPAVIRVCERVAAISSQAATTIDNSVGPLNYETNRAQEWRNLPPGCGR